MYHWCSQHNRSFSGKPVCQKRSRSNHWPCRHSRCCLRNVCHQVTRSSLRLMGSISRLIGRLGILCPQDNRHGRGTRFGHNLFRWRDRSRFCGRRAHMGYLTYPTSDLSRIDLNRKEWQWINLRYRETSRERVKVTSLKVWKQLGLDRGGGIAYIRLFQGRKFCANPTSVLDAEGNGGRALLLVHTKGLEWIWGPFSICYLLLDILMIRHEGEKKQWYYWLHIFTSQLPCKFESC